MDRHSLKNSVFGSPTLKQVLPPETSIFIGGDRSVIHKNRQDLYFSQPSSEMLLGQPKD